MSVLLAKETLTEGAKLKFGSPQQLIGITSLAQTYALIAIAENIEASTEELKAIRELMRETEDRATPSASNI